MLKLVITDLGKAALLEAENAGFSGVDIKYAKLGDGQHNPQENAEHLENEVAQVDVQAGESLAGNILHLTIHDSTDAVYSVGEIGIYIDGDILFALAAQPSEDGYIIEKDTSADLLLAVDFAITSIDVNSLNFGNTNFLNPPASENKIGSIKTSTALEAINKENNDTALTPKRLFEILSKFNLTADDFEKKIFHSGNALSMLNLTKIWEGESWVVDLPSLNENKKGLYIVEYDDHEDNNKKKRTLIYREPNTAYSTLCGNTVVSSGRLLTHRIAHSEYNQFIAQSISFSTNLLNHFTNQLQMTKIFKVQ